MPLFDIRKGSDSSFKEVRDISTLEALLSIIKEFNHDIVVGTPICKDTDYYLTIYDDYLE